MQRPEGQVREVRESWSEARIDTGRQDAKGNTIWRPRYGWHDLRHIAASNWLNDGIDLKRLRTWIGHENIQLGT